MPANVEQMAYRYAGRHDVPWHGEGVAIDRNEEITWQEFMKRAGAEWTISKRPVWWKPHPDQPAIKHPTAEVLQRDDNFFPLNVVTKQYNEVQNEQIFKFFHEFCARGDMILETGGVLDHGRKVWCLATLKEGFTLPNHDRVTGNLLCSDARDGSAARAKFTPTRVVCANTLAVALAGGNQGYRLNHRSVFDPEDVKRVLGLSHQQLEKFKEQAEFLVSRPMSSVAFHEFLERLFPVKIHVDDKGNETVQHPRAFDYANAALLDQKGAELNQGTWWSGFNAITYMLDHNKNRISDNASRLNNSWFGAGATIREKALATALEMAK